MKKFKAIMFWTLSLTWGAILTYPGLIIGLVALCVGRGHTYHRYLRFEIGGDDWGGFDLGPVFFTDRNTTEHICQHESGHGVQNIIFGPFMLFVVSIPSLTRYWMREMSTVKGMRIFAAAELAIFGLISAAIIIPSAIYGIWALLAVGGAWGLYSIGQYIWAAWVEATKYKTSRPRYDDAWFEGDATRRGEKLYP